MTSYIMPFNNVVIRTNWIVLCLFLVAAAGCAPSGQPYYCEQTIGDRAVTASGGNPFMLGPALIVGAIMEVGCDDTPSYTTASTRTDSEQIDPEPLASAEILASGEQSASDVSDDIGPSPNDQTASASTETDDLNSKPPTLGEGSASGSDEADSGLSDNASTSTSYPIAYARTETGESDPDLQAAVNPPVFDASEMEGGLSYDERRKAIDRKYDLLAAERKRTCNHRTGCHARVEREVEQLRQSELDSLELDEYHERLAEIDRKYDLLAAERKQTCNHRTGCLGRVEREIDQLRQAELDVLEAERNAEASSVN